MMTPREYYQSAAKQGLKEYSQKTSIGQIGYLTSLEGLLKDTEIVSQINLGIFEIPLKKIKGTYTHLRSLSFAANFMPVVSNSEFRDKWEHLCEAHLEEGIRDPIKVYEYLNWYYVVEGNKRVSVLKYFGAYSISAQVTRLIPKLDSGNPKIEIYYEFLKFNKKTKISSIWFSKKNRFQRLLNLLEKFEAPENYFENKYKYFEIYIYNTFRKVYKSMGGDKIHITTGDAFLEYAKIYGIPKTVDEKELSVKLKEFMKELDISTKRAELTNIQKDPDEIPQGSVFSTLTTLIRPQKKLKAAFVYARTAESSGWTYGHELGRQYIDKVMGDQVTTSYVDMVPENGGAYDYIKKLVLDNNDIIFTTSPVFRTDTLKCAFEYPNVKFFNCSEHHPYKHLSNYYGRTYEARFLTGLIAGAMTKTHILGYAATSPSPEVVSCINAFALGAKMVNPFTKVKVVWTKEWNSHNKFTDADKKLIAMNTDIISNRNLSVPREVTTKFGVYSMLCSMNVETGKPIHHLAAPVWQWGIFYQRILESILNNTYKDIMDIFSNNSKLLNFWWGIDSGAIDIYYSKQYVPKDTQKLVELMKKMIISNDYNPFTGPIYDMDGNLRVEDDDVASNEDILSMNWFVDNVEPEPYE